MFQLGRLLFRVQACHQGQCRGSCYIHSELVGTDGLILRLGAHHLTFLMVVVAEFHADAVQACGRFPQDAAQDSRVPHRNSRDLVGHYWLQMSLLCSTGAQQAAMGLLLAPKPPPIPRKTGSSVVFPQEFTFYNRL